MILSICIPTFNRVKQLDDCLNSILISQNNVDNFSFEICISDNNSNQNTEEVIKKYSKKLHISFHKNTKNFGFAINGIKTVSMAKGKYSWMIGDDDLILPDTLLKIKKILESNLDKDYFFINSYHLKSSYLEKFSSPFDTKHLNLKTMKTISKLKKDKQGNFWDAIDPKVSWDFLIGIYLNIFNTKKWLNSLDIINQENIKDTKVWSNFDNTCLHPAIISNAFKKSKIYICAEPLSVNLIGEREWKTMYEFIEIVRIPELLEYYRSQGMPFLQYLYCKNFSLRNFFNYFIKIIIGGNKSGLKYVNFKKHFLLNLLYPYVYLSIIFYLIRKLKNIIKI